ncbi:MAG: hypothetical protein HYU29_03205 [Chloroflexi bacterium]|nr:hypothetical protein [Chloroflexota bacterium]
MLDSGIKLNTDRGGSRLEMGCEHQNGLIYAVPGEASWVCSQDKLAAHALAGFLRELVALRDPRVTALMRRWGLYFRSRPVHSAQKKGQETLGEQEGGTSAPG